MDHVNTKIAFGFHNWCHLKRLNHYHNLSWTKHPSAAFLYPSWEEAWIIEIGSGLFPLET